MVACASVFCGRHDGGRHVGGEFFEERDACLPDSGVVFARLL